MAQDKQGRVTITFQVPRNMAEKIAERVRDGDACSTSDFVRQSLLKNLIE